MSSKPMVREPRAAEGGATPSPQATTRPPPGSSREVCQRFHEAVELIGEPTRVGVEGLANENFVSYDDYLGEHFTNVISLVLFRQGVADLNSPVVDGTPTRFQFGAKGAQSFWFCRC